jgi:hypothetical protein
METEMDLFYDLFLDLPWRALFIKNADAFFASAISGSYPDIADKIFQEE